MKVLILLVAFFPVIYAVIQGILIKKTDVEHRPHFHTGSLLGFVAHYIAVAATIPYGKLELYQLGQLAILAGVSKVTLFDGVVALMLGEGWLYIGITAKWDRFCRGLWKWVPFGIHINWWKIHINVDSSIGQVLGRVCGLLLALIKIFGIFIIAVLIWALWLI